MLALAERPLKNVSITTPESHTQPLAPSTLPAVEPAPTPWNQSSHGYANIHEGRWLTSAYLHVAQTWVANRDYFLLSVGTSLEHFFADRWALGGSFSINRYSDQTDLYLGPSTTYYFYVEDRVGAYVDTSLTYELLDKYEDAIRWKASLGMRYFITPAVAMGPAVYFNHDFGIKYRVDTNQFGLLAVFALHL